MFRKKLRILYITFLFICMPFLGLLQIPVSFNLGAVVSLGTHQNAFGINAQLSYAAYFFQINAAVNSKINFTSYGKRKQFLENRFALGGVLLGGKKNQPIDFQRDALLHNTNFSYGIGYNYLWYWDDAGTTQKSGGWSLAIKRWSLLFENDVFGGQAKDHFRTGILELAYRDEHWKYFTQLYIWTGETKNSVWIRESTPTCPNGYRSLEHLPYGKTSHGIGSFGIRTNVFRDVLEKNPQTLSFKMGIDSEEIRHFFQNRMSHDLIFLPKKVKRNTPHYPRLNALGKPVFTNQERRKDLFYLQSSLNGVWSE